MPSLVNGLGGLAGFGEGFLQSNDDRSTASIDITSIFGADGLYLNGAHYKTLFVNNNGNITFGGPLASGDPIAMGQAASPLVIAPYWMDLDGTGSRNPSPGGTSTGTQFVFFDLDASHKTFTATWDDIGYSPTHATTPAAFQVQLIDAGGGDFDIAFIYEFIGPVGADQPNIARAGFSLGRTGGVATSYELAASGNATQIALVDTSAGNTGQAGVWMWHIRGGKLIGPSDPPVTPPPTEPPVTPPVVPPVVPPVTPPVTPPITPPPTEPPVMPPVVPPVTPPPVEPPVTPPIVPAADVTFSVSGPGLHREGDTGVTSFDVQIGRAGDLLGPSTVRWVIVIDDPTDLAPGQALSGEAVFGIGQESLTIPISVLGDKVFEQDEQFLFKLVSATHGANTFDPGGSSFGVIINDDAPVTFAFSGPQLRPEGLSGSTPFEFTVIRAGELGLASTVRWELTPGEADAFDFAAGQPLSGVVTFAAGESQAKIIIQVAGDARPEFDEIFGIKLTSATTGTATFTPTAATTGTILDDDIRHSLLVSTPTALVLPEGNSGTTAFNFNLLRTGDLSLAVTTGYHITLPVIGGVSAGEIQTPLDGVVTFAAGVAEAMLTVVVNADTTPEDNEAFSVALGGGDFNDLTLSGVVMNDDQSSGFGAPIRDLPLGLGGMDGEPTSFIELLVGGTLWAGAGGL